MSYKRAFYSVMRVVAMIIMWPALRYKITNGNSLPQSGRYIISANHISNTDPIVIGIGQRRHLRFMAKAELFRSAFLRWFFVSLGGFPIERGKGDRDAIENVKDMISNGDAVGIFIEGTRSKTGELLRPKNGAVMLAHQMNCKILPASICVRTKKFHWFSRRYVRFGTPVTTAELGVVNGSPREFRDASRQLMELISELRKQDLQ